MSRMGKKGKRGKAGVSVVVSDLLMLAIIIVALTVVLGFVAGYISNYQATSGSAIMERLLIEDVWVDKINNKVDITFYNYGKVSLTVNAIYINGNPVSGFTPFLVTVGEHKSTGWLSLPEGVGGGGTYKLNIKVVTERGYYVEGNFVIT